MCLDYVLLKQPIAKLSPFKIHGALGRGMRTTIRLMFKNPEDSNYALKYDASQKIVVVEKLPEPESEIPAEFFFILSSRRSCLETV